MGEENGNYAELFNHARTAAYLQGSTALGCGTVYGVLDDGGCSAYPWMPTDDDSDYVEFFFTDPVSDDAPWYNSNYPESGEGLGFWITEWTGLDSGHIRRGLSPVGAYRGGGQLGASYSGAREMGFEVILLGESEAALDYLFRWLDATIASVCVTCATDSILIRRICPTGTIDEDNADDGVVELREVGLLQGLSWGAPPVEQAGCFIRRANFTLAAQDPCMYTACTDISIDQSATWATCFAGDNVNTDRVNCRPSCSEMPGECRTTFDFTIDTVGASAPRILVAASDTSTSVRYRIRVYSNDLALPPEDICGAPLLCELYVAPLPAYTELLYDVPGRQVLIRTAATGVFVSGYAYVEANDIGIPRFAGLGCGDFTVVVEPADFCFDSPPGAAEGYGDISGSVQERMGCA